MAESEALAAWERDYAYEVALSPARPGPDTSGSEEAPRSSDEQSYSWEFCATHTDSDYDNQSDI